MSTEVARVVSVLFLAALVAYFYKYAKHYSHWWECAPVWVDSLFIALCFVQFVALVLNVLAVTISFLHDGIVPTTDHQRLMVALFFGMVAAAIALILDNAVCQQAEERVKAKQTLGSFIAQESESPPPIWQIMYAVEDMMLLLCTVAGAFILPISAYLSGETIYFGLPAESGFARRLFPIGFFLAILWLVPLVVGYTNSEVRRLRLSLRRRTLRKQRDCKKQQPPAQEPSTASVTP